jgi:hypothetical protein
LTPAERSRSNAATTSIAPTTASSVPGTRGNRFRTRIVASVPSPIAVAVGFTRPSTIAAPMRAMSRSGPASSIEKPSSLGTWLISTVKAMPFM